MLALDLGQVPDAGEIDDRVGPQQPHVHHRHEALPAGDHPRRPAVGLEVLDRLGRRRRPVIPERSRLHRRPAAVSRLPMAMIVYNHTILGHGRSRDQCTGSGRAGPRRGDRRDRRPPSKPGHRLGKIVARHPPDRGDPCPGLFRQPDPDPRGAHPAERERPRRARRAIAGRPCCSSARPTSSRSTICGRCSNPSPRASPPSGPPEIWPTCCRRAATDSPRCTRLRRPISSRRTPTSTTASPTPRAVRRLCSLIHQVCAIPEAYRSSIAYTPGDMEEAERQHRAIATAIGRHRSNDAARLMHRHISWAGSMAVARLDPHLRAE